MFNYLIRLLTILFFYWGQLIFLYSIFSTSTASSSSDLKPIADNIAGEIVDKKGVEVAKKVEDGLKDYADENDIPSEDESTEGVYDDQIAGIEGKLETLRQELEDIINQDVIYAVYLGQENNNIVVLESNK